MKFQTFNRENENISSSCYDRCDEIIDSTVDFSPNKNQAKKGQEGEYREGLRERKCILSTEKDSSR